MFLSNGIFRSQRRGRLKLCGGRKLLNRPSERCKNQDICPIVQAEISEVSLVLSNKHRFRCVLTSQGLGAPKIIITIIIIISIYKLGDVGVASNLIGSLSLINGQCLPPGRWIMKQWPTGVNSRRTAKF